VDRNEIRPEHFKSWIDWAKSIGIGLDFNPTCFSHPKAADGFTLSHADKAIRKFWIQHCILCREIGAVIGKALGSPAVTNIWIPDGMKDTPADRRGPRERLAAALDEVFQKPLDPRHNLDSIEGKLFGIGAESYTVGMHEFYLGYAVKHQKLICLDAGHFHPTENMADKISSVLCFVPEILLHVSRGVRWDSDHVVILDDPLMGIAQELVRGDYLGRTHIGLDYFDASINRIAAWVIGARNMLRALCIAKLDPIDKLKKLELEGDYTSRLALMEEAKSLPFAAVWDYYCLKTGAPVGEAWLAEVKRHEKDVLSKRK
jgi:L-rhamnose isomerase